MNDELLEYRIRATRERYYNQENNFGIYVCTIMDTKTDDIVFTGNMPQLMLYRTYVVKCQEVIHPKFGLQYKVFSIYSEEFVGNEELEFLATLVTEKQYEAITKVYEKPITAIQNEKFDYKLIKGLGEKSFKKLKDKIYNNMHLMKALAVLSKFGISYNIVKKVVEKYGSADVAVSKITENPYILYHDIDGIGFITADGIAKLMGIPHDDPKRLYAGVLYTLETLQSQGHTWTYLDAVQEKAQELLQEGFDDFVDFLKDKNEVVIIENKLALKSTYICEKEIALQLKRLKLSYKVPMVSNEAITKFVDSIEQETGVAYTDEQKDLLYKINTNNVLVFTGAAGCGKSFCLKLCLRLLDMLDKSYLLLSPTAKASKIITKYTGVEAKTIHRGLEWTPEGFRYNDSNKLPYEVIIIDEVSMIDQMLCKNLLRAINSGSKVLFVGDSYQLESVLCGNILHDMINSNVIPVVKLHTVFRQALNSGILSTATSVREGKRFINDSDQSIQLGNDKSMKCWLGDKEQSAKRVETIIRKILETRPIEDVLIISPVKRGASGVWALNTIIQEIYNPASHKPQLDIKRCIFRVGDRVRHTKNDYDREHLDENFDIIENLQGVYNGDFGIIKYIDTEDRIIYVQYPDKIIGYNSLNLDQLELAYCITCHAAQGSQTPIVVGVVDFGGYMNLKRSLLYTMITRASEVCYLVGETKAINVAIGNNATNNKRTFLKDLLKEFDN